MGQIDAMHERLSHLNNSVGNVESKIKTMKRKQKSREVSPIRVEGSHEVSLMCSEIESRIYHVFTNKLANAVDKLG